VPDLVRLVFVGRGHLLLVRLRLLETLGDEPLAATLLLRSRALLRHADLLRPLARRARPGDENRFWSE
jgi:hypothetical protein